MRPRLQIDEHSLILTDGPVQEQPDLQTVTVEQLIDKANDAMDKMSLSNPNKRLIWMLGSALSSLADRYAELGVKIEELKAQIAALTAAGEAADGPVQEDAATAGTEDTTESREAPPDAVASAAGEGERPRGELAP